MGIVLAWIAAAAFAACPLKDPSRVTAGPALNPEAVAYTLAPVLHVEAARDPDRRHWDLPMAVDFDGNRVGADNAEALRGGRYRDAIVPTLYYAVLETETHVFATFHSFHGLDWTWLPNLFTYAWHENDGENLQIVARKVGDGVSGLVVEHVATQAHLSTHLAGRLPGWGPRVPVYMERGGHGLYPAPRRADRFVLGPGEPRLRRGIRLEPAAPGDAVAPPAADDRDGRYALAPMRFDDPADLGPGRLLDTTFAYCDAIVGERAWPRHYDSDLVSGPGKRDSGIAAFALDRGLVGRDVVLGALFFDPATRWPQLTEVNGPWSTTYVRHPWAAGGVVALPPTDAGRTEGGEVP